MITQDRPTQTVLVVDDDLGIRNLLTRWIEQLGYQVRTVADAHAALELMETCEVDLALCDVRMPGPDGIWLAEHIRRNFPGVAVVFATGVQEMDPNVTLRPGVTGYVVKPFRRDELAAAIREGLSWREKLTAQRTPLADESLETTLNF
jgi:CheY-like chemotaxis protein